MDDSELHRRLTEFINQWPLYTPLEIEFDEPKMRTPSLPASFLRACPTCSAEPTWSRINAIENSHAARLGAGMIVAWRCSHCTKERLFLWVEQRARPLRDAGGDHAGYSHVILRKFGQVPPQHAELPRQVERGLPKPAVEMYKKGLTSLAHGYGLAALAYFRRVIEDATNEVLDLFIRHAMDLDEHEAAERLRAARSNSQMEEQLRLAADALPGALRPGGVNPLAALYKHYSQGIHGRPDEECLVLARELVFVLDYTFSNWRAQMDEAAAFREHVTRWSDPTARPE